MAITGGDYIGAGIGMQAGASVGSIISGFFTAKTARKQGRLQAQMALTNAYNQADALKMNALSISRIAGEQEYALYMEQRNRLDAMNVRAANSGLAMEGSNVNLIASQAGVDARNRDALIRDSKNQQYQHILGSQQAITAGQNQAAYYRAMGSANAASQMWGGVASGLAGVGRAASDFGIAVENGYIK